MGRGFAGSESKIAQRRVIVGAAAKWPVILALALLDRQVVDAGDTQPIYAVLIIFPVLVAVAAEPVSTVVVAFIGEAHGDAVFTKRPDFLDQAVVELTLPLARQERFDGLSTVQEFRAVPPAAVGRIGERDALRIARVPRVLGHADLLDCGFECKGRKGRVALGHGGVLARYVS